MTGELEGPPGRSVSSNIGMCHGRASYTHAFVGGNSDLVLVSRPHLGGLDFADDNLNRELRERLNLGAAANGAAIGLKCPKATFGVLLESPR